MVLSHPHFHWGGSTIEIVNPMENYEEFHIDIAPSFGFLIEENSGFQFNILLKKNSIDSRIKDDLLLPIMWINIKWKIDDEKFLQILKENLLEISEWHSFFHVFCYLFMNFSFLVLVVSLIYLASKKFKRKKPEPVDENNVRLVITYW
jgi:hypothetical protein